jgi:drug/metabolite transporter (DMT)-like permease
MTGLRTDTPLAGIGLIVVAMCVIPIGDAAAKLLMNDGIPTLFVIWSRLALGVLLMLPFLNGIGESFKLLTEWRVMVRASFALCGIICMLLAMETEALATVFGVFFIGPIISYFLSALLLGERLTLAQTVVLLAGFIGVLLVMQPGFLFALLPGGATGVGGVSRGTMLALVAGFAYSGFLISGRWLKAHARPRGMIFAQLVLGTVILAPFGLTNVPPLGAGLAGLTVVSSAASVAGNILILLAYRRTEASRLAPFVYLQLIAITLLGYLLFSELPDGLTFAGLGLLISSGFVSTWLSLRVSKGRGK